MEAITRHDFNAISEDELSFRKHQLLIVTNKEDETYWYRAELDGRQGVIPYNYIELKNHDWYFGKITRANAEKLLLTKHDGAFLIRISEAALGDFSLSVKCSEGVQHFKVLRDVQGKFFLWMTKFYSLNALVEHYHNTSVLQTRNIRLKDILSKEIK